MKDFELDDVYTPEVAVRLAVRYIADLLKLFPKSSRGAGRLQYRRAERRAMDLARSIERRRPAA